LADPGERDAEGFSESASWYWLYRFDFGERAYEARVYRDAPELAFVSGPTRWSQAPSDPYLRAVARHLEAEAGASEVHLRRPRGDYERVLFSI
jgi:hypothetical protein